MKVQSAKADLRIPRDKLNCLWVSHFYDHPLAGLCSVNGELCRFEVGYRQEKARIYRMRWWEKLRWIADKRLFELCVGRHFTYPRTERFHYRRPRWLHRMLFRIYYRKWRIA